MVIGLKETKFCPYCGYHSLIYHKDGTYGCPKCNTHFVTHQLQFGEYAGEEMWYTIPCFDGTYQVSTYYRIRRVIEDREIRSLSVYTKNNELYTSLYKNGRSREYNVSVLLKKAMEFSPSGV